MNIIYGRIFLVERYEEIILKKFVIELKGGKNHGIGYFDCNSINYWNNLWNNQEEKTLIHSVRINVDNGHWGMGIFL